MGLSSTLNIGRDALITQQKAIEITGHNIANVNTPGYSRQRLLLETKAPIATYAGQLGTGVQGLETQRIVDQYLGDQINNSAQDLGKWEARKNALERVEVVLDETSGFGLNNSMSEFWNAWQDLANNPSGNTERQTLLGKSINLSNTFQNIYSDLVEVRNDLDSSVSSAVNEINSLAAQIADLNTKIESIESKGMNPNDYLDTRDQLLKDLSQYINFTSSEAANGMVTVTLGDGNNLVDNTGAESLVANDNDFDGFLDIEWSDGTPINANNISGGKLSGWLQVRDTVIPAYLSDLDDLATALITDVNAIHSTGFGLNDLASNPFFSGTGASDIAVGITDPNDIAAAQNNNGVTGLYGDNTNAIAIANLQNTVTATSGLNATLDDYYSSIVSDVGIKVADAGINYDHQYAMSAQLSNYRESVSGVSLDEEMVNLIKFQYAYDAAAKLINTVDEMLDSLLRIV